LGLLDDLEKEQFEIHLLGCGHCLAQMEKLNEPVAVMRTDRAIQEAVAAQCDETDSGHNRLTSLGYRAWSATDVRFRPVFVVMVAVLLLIAGYVMSEYLSRLDVTTVQTVTLAPNRSAANETFDRSLDQDGLLSIVVENAAPGRRFDLVVLDSRGRELSRPSPFNAADSFVVCRLLFPSKLMNPGTYSVLVISASDGTVVDTVRYCFRVVDQK
jgi:hypothetical protein